MGAGEAKRPLAARIGGSALRGLLSLLVFILILLLILRALAAWREGGAKAPANTTYFPTPAARVAARVVGPANGAPVILVHGTAAWSGFWSEVSDHLARRGWRVVAIDLPPFGWSDRALQVLKSVGHIPHIENPAAFRSALDQALASLPKEQK